MAEFEIVISYPHTGRYGKRGALDRDKVAEADRVAIESLVGWRGVANFTGTDSPPATPIPSQPAAREVGRANDFTVIRARFEYAAAPA